MIRSWRRTNEYTLVGMRSLINFYDCLKFILFPILNSSKDGV
jgi:hypothetical protein